MCQNPIRVCAEFLKTYVGLCIYHCSYGQISVLAQFLVDHFAHPYSLRSLSFSLKVFLFSHFFSCEMLLICRLKRIVSCFFFTFLFSGYSRSVVFFLVAVISLSLCFSMLSSNRYIDASTLSSTLVSPFLPSFLDKCNQSTSSLGFNALCMIISFSFFFFFCSLVHLFKFSSPLQECFWISYEWGSFWKYFCYIVLSRVTFWFS